jgi:hypothetical protein
LTLMMRSSRLTAMTLEHAGEHGFQLAALAHDRLQSAFQLSRHAVRDRPGRSLFGIGNGQAVCQFASARRAAPCLSHLFSGRIAGMASVT